MNEQGIRQQIELCEQSITQQYSVLRQDAAKIGTVSKEAASSRTALRILIAMACSIGFGIFLCIMGVYVMGIILIILGFMLVYKVYDSSSAVTLQVENLCKNFYGTLDQYLDI